MDYAYYYRITNSPILPGDKLDRLFSFLSGRREAHALATLAFWNPRLRITSNTGNRPRFPDPLHCSIATGIIGLILQPLLFPLLYFGTWALLAFQNSAKEVLPEYWSNYPMRYFDTLVRNIQLGFPTLVRCLVKGFSDLD
jgi:hypothetical protein